MRDCLVEVDFLALSAEHAGSTTKSFLGKEKLLRGQKENSVDTVGQCHGRYIREKHCFPVGRKRKVCAGKEVDHLQTQLVEL